MKKRIMRALMVLCAGIMIFSFSACSDKKGGEESYPAIVGKWEYEDSSQMYYKFEKDGTGMYSFVGNELKFTYEDDGEVLTIEYENTSVPNVFKYRIENNKPIIEDSFGDEITYIKK